MKPVRRLPSEPPELAGYIAVNPVDASAPCSQAKDVWDRFRNDLAYKAVLEALVQAQQGVCLYCEQRLVDAQRVLVHNDYQVEHVLAKSGGTGRTLDWTNLALACGGGTYPHHPDESRRGTGKPNESCGQTKGDGDLPPGCDPRGFPGVKRLVTVDVQGRLSADAAACAAAGVSAVELGRAITETLHLNCERLRLRREYVLDNVRTWLVPILQALLEGAHLTAAQRHRFGYTVIASRLQPDARGMLRAFWTTERCGLTHEGQGAEQWCVDNAALFT